jgi:hypothetical protein
VVPVSAPPELVFRRHLVSLPHLPAAFSTRGPRSELKLTWFSFFLLLTYPGTLCGVAVGWKLLGTKVTALGLNTNAGALGLRRLPRARASFDVGFAKRWDGQKGREDGVEEGREEEGRGEGGEEGRQEGRTM